MTDTTDTPLATDTAAPATGPTVTPIETVTPEDAPATSADTPTDTTSSQNVIHKAIAEAKSIVEGAEKEAARILNEADSILAETRTYIATAHNDIAHPLQFICSSDSKIGDALDKLLGAAAGCYCCSALRMGLIGFGAGIVASALSAGLYFIL